MIKNRQFLPIQSVCGLLLITCFLSCEKEVVYAIEEEHYTTADFQSCEIEQCPNFSIDFFKLKQPEALKDVVNEKVTSFLEINLNTAATKEKDLLPMIENYINDAQTAYPEDSVFSGFHEMIIDISIMYRSNTLFSMAEYAYKFDGGAHGFERLHYSNFDARSGKSLTNEELITDVPGFLAFAKAEFQNKYPESGVQFEDYFDLKKANVGFNEEGLVIYQKMPFAVFELPEIELTLAWDALSNLLSI